MSKNAKTCVDCSRRTALKLGGVGLLTATTGVTGCWGPQDTLSNPVVVALADYPALADDGGIVFIPTSVSGHDHPIIVRNVAGDYDAMSSECNHASCSVEREGEKFVCPCHGSEYQLDGSLIEGPATRSLLPFVVTRDGDNLTIAN